MSNTNAETNGPATTTLVDAIAEAMSEAAQVSKSSTNTEQKYKFASAEAILAAVRMPLLTRGVILTAEIVDSIAEEITARSGTKGSLITITVDFTFRGHGDELTIRGWRGQGQDYGDKALGKAYTNAVKTFIRTQWLLPTEHDDPESSDPGERVGPAQLPNWALAATNDRKKAMVAALAPIFGEDAVKAIGQNVAGVIGHVPDGFVGFALALADSMPRTPVDAEPEEEATLDDVIEQLLKASPEELAKIADTHPRDDVRQMATEEIASRAGIEPVADKPAPGTIKPPELEKDPAKAFGALKAAGCTCEDPIGVRHDKPVLDTACPIAGHGIPF